MKNTSNKIYVAGHRGMVGSAIVRRLRAEGYEHIITRTHAELDLTNQLAVRHFFYTRKTHKGVPSCPQSWGNSCQ